MSNRDGEKSKPDSDGILSSLENAEFNVRKNFEKATRQISDNIGRRQNEIVENLTHTHISAQYVASISPALARQYLQGRDIMAARRAANKSLSDLTDLSASQRQSAQTFQKLHSDLPSQIPFYNKEILARDLERDIVRRATSAHQEDRYQSQSQPGKSSADGFEQIVSSRKDSPEKAFPDRSTSIEKTTVQRIELVEKGNQKTTTTEKNLPGNALISALESRLAGIGRVDKSAGQVEKSPGHLDNQPGGHNARDSERKKDVLQGKNDSELIVQIDKTISGNGIISGIISGISTGISSGNSSVGNKGIAANLTSDVNTSISASFQFDSAIKVDSLAENDRTNANHTLKTEQESFPLASFQTIQNTSPKNALAEDIRDPVYYPKNSDEKSDSHKIELESDNRHNSAIKTNDKVLSSFANSASGIGVLRVIPASQSRIASAGLRGLIRVAPTPERVIARSTIKIPTALISVGKTLRAVSPQISENFLPINWLKARLDTSGQTPIRLPSGLLQERESEREHENKQFNLEARTKAPERNDSPGQTKQADKSAHQASAIAPQITAEIHGAQAHTQPGTADCENKSAPDSTISSEESPTAHKSLENITKQNSKQNFRHDDHDAKHTSNSIDKSSAIPPEKHLDALQEVKAKDFKFTCNEKNQKYLSGPELVFAAIIALAGTARLRTEISPLDSIAIMETYSATENKMLNDENALAKDNTVITADRLAQKNVSVRPKILIGMHDTLVSIAEQLFNDHGIAWLILRVNPELSRLIVDGKTVVRLTSRQEIFIPVYQDIVQFQQLRSKEMSAENLVTIVEENQFDREILDLSMAVFSGPGENRDPLQKLEHSEHLNDLQELQELQIVSDESTSGGNS